MAEHSWHDQLTRASLRYSKPDCHSLVIPSTTAALWLCSTVFSLAIYRRIRLLGLPPRTRSRTQPNLNLAFHPSIFKSKCIFRPIFYKLIKNLSFVNQQVKVVNHDHLDNHLNIFLINILSRFCLKVKIKITNYWYQNIEIISVHRLLFPTNICGYPKKICSTVLSVCQSFWKKMRLWLSMFELG